MKQQSSPSPDVFREWRQAEDQFYAAVLADPDMYMAGVRLVRAIADSLVDIDDLDQLTVHYRDLDAGAYVADVVRRLERPQLALLDHGRAFGAAFRIRSQEIVYERHEREALRSIADARERGEDWAVLFAENTERNGVALFTRVEMHLASGVGMRTASELDWERGLVYVMEPLRLDRETGHILSNADTPGDEQEFSTLEDLQHASADFRRRESGA